MKFRKCEGVRPAKAEKNARTWGIHIAGRLAEKKAGRERWVDEQRVRLIHPSSIGAPPAVRVARVARVSCHQTHQPIEGAKSEPRSPFQTQWFPAGMSSVATVGKIADGILHVSFSDTCNIASK